MTGDGAPLVFLHAFPFDGRMWQPQVEGLSKRAQLIVVDLAGFGRSTVQQPPVTVEDHAFDVVHLLDALHIERATLVGCSMGGYIALAFARRYAHRLSGLVLANTKASPDTPEQKRGRDDAIARIETEGTSPFLSGLLPKLLAPNAPARLAAQVRAMAETQSVEACSHALEAMRDRIDATELLASLDVPVTLIAGSADQVIPLDVMRGMKKTQPDAELVVIEGSGHLSNLEAPDQFNRALLATLGAAAH